MNPVSVVMRSRQRMKWVSSRWSSMRGKDDEADGLRPFLLIMAFDSSKPIDGAEGRIVSSR